jgi:hypothetical protein
LRAAAPSQHPTSIAAPPWFGRELRDCRLRPGSLAVRADCVTLPSSGFELRVRWPLGTPAVRIVPISLPPPAFSPHPTAPVGPSLEGKGQKCKAELRTERAKRRFCRFVCPFSL